jgi:hypothetical protein
VQPVWSEELPAWEPKLLRPAVLQPAMLQLGAPAALPVEQLQAQRAAASPLQREAQPVFRATVEAEAARQLRVPQAWGEEALRPRFSRELEAWEE